MKKLEIDVMLGGRFIKTLRMPYCPLFTVKEEEIRDFVESKLPTLKGEDYKVFF